MEDRDRQSDLLENYTARELIAALHWTGKKDLHKALIITNNQQNIVNKLWKDLTNADRGLQQFYPSDLAAIIETYKLNFARNKSNYSYKEH